jgi:class 3 adenylate cyclase
MEKSEGRFISSIDLLNKTGLSRATLNNYIKAGILPHPVVKRPNDSAHSKAKRIGYFPDFVLDTLSGIIQYKKEGRSMAEIRKSLTGKSDDSLGRTQIKGILATPDGVHPFDRVNESEELFPLEEIRIGSVPPDMPAQGVTEILSAKERAAQDLFHQRMPIPLSFSVLAADLQDSMRMCAELPPEEYFSLINQIWLCAKGTFKKYFGIYGKHAGNGMVYYFLKDRHSNYLMNAILCALELREKMKKLSDEWKKDTGWYDNLYLNVGINEGYEFFGRIPAAPAVEFITLGDTANDAVRLSDFARCGSIWTTKNLLNRLDEKERKKIHYGIRRSQSAHDVLIENVFSRIVDLIPQDSDKYTIFNDISTMTVTEIHNLR